MRWLPVGKQQAETIHNSLASNSAALQLIHTDVFGPINTAIKMHATTCLLSTITPAASSYPPCATRQLLTQLCISATQWSARDLLGVYRAAESSCSLVELNIKSDDDCVASWAPNEPRFGDATIGSEGGDAGPVTVAHYTRALETLSSTLLTRGGKHVGYAYGRVKHLRPEVHTTCCSWHSARTWMMAV